jgi:RNA polymerase sigma-70 factor (ECF subfamily)
MNEEVDQLVRRVRQGEIEAYAEIVRRLEQPVWRVVAALLPRMDQARDVMQKVFVEAYLHLDQYQIGRDFTAWIKTIARNQVRQELRRWNRESKHLSYYRAFLLQQMEHPAQEEQEQLYHDALQACLERLPPVPARALHLRYNQGAAFEHIAAALGTTKTAVEKLLSRARRALRDCIEARLAQA